MPIYRGTQKVTPRRAGVDLARVYRGDRLVWEAIITVTPQAPTFHDGDPWYTLPQQEGVTYTVAGTPDWGASITITASAEDGYQLDGQTEWAHTYGPPPRYVASGSNNTRTRISSNTWTTMDTHTVTADGAASGYWEVEWRFVSGPSHTFSIRVRQGTTTLATETIGGDINNWGEVRRISIPETILTAGDNLTFEAHTTNSQMSTREINSWSWNLS